MPVDFNMQFFEAYAASPGLKISASLGEIELFLLDNDNDGMTLEPFSQ